MRVMLRVRAALHIRKVLLILALKRSFESLRSKKPLIFVSGFFCFVEFIAGHARKMAHRMIDQGHEVLYLENTEGGHGCAANKAHRAKLAALENTFLWVSLGG